MSGNINNSNAEYKILNKEYIWASRAAAVLCVVALFPIHIDRMFRHGHHANDALILSIYVYLLVSNFILRSRLFNLPAWSVWIVPNSWVEHWRYLSCVPHIKDGANNNKLYVIVVMAALVMIYLLGKLPGNM